MKDNKKIIDELSIPALKEQRILLRSLKNVLPANMSLSSVSIYSKGSQVYIGTENAIIAQKWIFLKSEILKSIRDVIPNIKEIRVRVEPQERLYLDHKRNSFCERCDSRQIMDGQDLCALCKSQMLDEQRVRVYAFLREAPWIRYDELEAMDKTLIDYEGFMRERTFQIQRIYDKIGLEYWGWVKTKDPKSLDKIKTIIEEYVITKLNIHPQHLTSDLIRSQVSARWFKLYSSSGQAKEH